MWYQNISIIHVVFISIIILKVLPLFMVQCINIYLHSGYSLGLRRGLKVFNVFIIIYWVNCLFIIGK